MKVKVRRGRVVDMSKTMDPAEADGENLGIVKFGAAGAPHLVGILDRLVRGAANCVPGRRGPFASSRRHAPLFADRHARLPLDRDRLSRGLSPRRARHPARDRCGKHRASTVAGDIDRPAPDGRRAMRPGDVRTHRFDDRWSRGRRRRDSARAAPRIVAIGGGTGLPNVLRGLRPMLFADGAHDATRDRLVAVVATSDDGGSSGRLRAEFNMIPPGDIRNCLAALSGNQSQIADLFQYRFGAGEGLNGHAIGNLVLAALADVTNDFARGRGNRRAHPRHRRHRAAGDLGARDAGRRVHRRSRAERRDRYRGSRWADRAAGAVAGAAALLDRV